MIRLFQQYVSAKSLFLVFLDGALITLALLCAAGLRFWNSPPEFSSYVQMPLFALQALTVVLAFQVCFYYNDLYDANHYRGRNDGFARLGRALGAACLLLGLLYFLVPSLLIGRGVLFIGMALVSVFMVGSRVVIDKTWPLTSPRQKILIVGTGELASAVAREFSRRDDLNVEIAGFVRPDSVKGPTPDVLYGRPILGSTASLEKLALDNNISRVVVAMEDYRGALPARDLVKLRVSGLLIEDAHTAMAALTGRVWLQTVRPSWFVFSDGFHRSRIIRAAKRCLDVISALTGLLISLPVMLLVAVLVRLDSKGPVLYRQSRVGLRGRCFEVLKFRTMRVDAEKSGAQWSQDNDPRITRIGRPLRKFRLDELPQFLNVIRGEMSFVGPRPERPCFVEMLRTEIPYYDERHTVRPGLTGWAQVQYPYGASVEDARRKLEYDLFYLKNLSISFDCAIIFNTVRIVFGGRGGR